MRTKMKTRTKPYVFFDQNIMERVYKKKVQYATFQKNVKSLVTEKGNIKQRLTPFGLLEFVGLKKSELFDIEHNDHKLAEYPFRSYQEVEDFIPCLQKKIQNKISKEFLINKLQQQNDFINELGLALIDEYIKALSEQSNPSSKKRYIYITV